MRGDPFVCSCFFVRNDEELSIFINFPRWLCAPVLMDHGSWIMDGPFFCEIRHLNPLALVYIGQLGSQQGGRHFINPE